MNSDEKVSATFIFEVLGKPAEHLTETLNKIVEKFGEEKSIKLIDKKVNEPIPVKDKEEFFTNFAEVEAEFAELSHLVLLIFKYMPAHVDIISPENLNMSNNSLSVILNELARRLHGYDEVTRVSQIEKSILEKKLKALMEDKEKKD